MPKLSTDDYTITVNGTAFSDHLAGIDITLSKATYESTAFGMGWDEHVPGRKNATVRLSFHADYGANSVDAIVWPLYSGTGYATVVAKPTSGTTTSTNPAYTAVCHVTSYQPVSGNFGQLATLDVTWTVQGTVARGTA